MADTYEISNPILQGMYPDPSWIWDDRWNEAVLVNSTFDLVPGLPLHTSSDLATWTHVGDAIDRVMARRLFLPFVEDSGGVYAPTLRKIGGRYAIACTIARLNQSKALAAGVAPEELAACQASAGNFVIEADQLEGPWRGPYWVKGADLIDPDLFEDQDGCVFWTQTRPAVEPEWEGQTEVWTCQIDPASWQLIGQPVVLWRGFGREAVWAEGPHLYRLGDYVYLWTAEGGTSFDHSEMVMRAYAPQGFRAALAEAVQAQAAAEGAGSVATASTASAATAAPGTAYADVSKSLFRPNKKNPVLTHRHLGLAEAVQCVGHTDLLRHPRLGWWLVCLGVRETRVTGSDIAVCSFLGRESFVSPVSWEQDPAAWSISASAEGVDTPETVTAAIASVTAADLPTGTVPLTAVGSVIPADPGWPVVAPGLGRLPVRIRVNGQRSLTYELLPAVEPAEATAEVGAGQAEATAGIETGLESATATGQAQSGDDLVQVGQALLPDSAEADWQYLRLSSDRCLIEVCQDRLALRQDSLNRLSLFREGKGDWRLVLLRAGKSEERLLSLDRGSAELTATAGQSQGWGQADPEPSAPARLALCFERGFVEVCQLPTDLGQPAIPATAVTTAAALSESAGESDTVLFRLWSGQAAQVVRAAATKLTEPIDVTHLSTEKSGGFVGCLIGA